jgi:hypothetical protein
VEEPEGPLYREWETDPNKGLDNGFKTAHFPAIPRRDREAIHPLAEEYAVKLWHWVTASKGHVVQLLEPTCWAAKLRAGKHLTWEEVIARMALPWAEDDAVFLLGCAGYGYEAPWRLFQRYWDRFLLSVWEDGILFHPTNRDACVFVASHWCWVGRRSDRRLTRRPLDGR